MGGCVRVCVSFTGPGDQNGMDCSDIVIGAAVDEWSRVGDYYTSDRSTPRHDEFYGGTQSLTAAIASQSDDGFTTVIFRRPVNGLLANDCSFFQERIGGERGNGVSVRFLFRWTHSPAIYPEPEPVSQRSAHSGS